MIACMLSAMDDYSACNFNAPCCMYAQPTDALSVDYMLISVYIKVKDSKYIICVCVFFFMCMESIAMQKNECWALYYMKCIDVLQGQGSNTIYIVKG